MRSPMECAPAVPDPRVPPAVPRAPQRVGRSARSPLVAALIGVALLASVYLGIRVCSADLVGAVDRFSRFAVLIDREELLELSSVELCRVVDVAQVLGTRIGRGDAQNLVIAAGLVG